ncbi:hypothetical protein ABZ914_03900 [Spirillospora sp. NPDC046719]
MFLLASTVRSNSTAPPSHTLISAAALHLHIGADGFGRFGLLGGRGTAARRTAAGSRSGSNSCSSAAVRVSNRSAGQAMPND